MKQDGAWGWRTCGCEPSATTFGEPVHFDDRLATVLRHRASGEASARTQIRQLVDLLGAPHPGSDPKLIDAAYLRLGALEEIVPLSHRARIAGDCSARIRSSRLVAWFGGRDPAIAAAALARAQLTEGDWETLIPELPIRARGLLRHRRDLPPGAVAMLDRLGARDRALPEPESVPPPPLQIDELATAPTIEPESESAPESPSSALREPSEIGALVQRIEAFQKAREASPAKTEDHSATSTPQSDAPRLPLGESRTHDEVQRAATTAFIFSTDTDGRIDWAEPAIAPQVVGIELVAHPALNGADLKNSFASAFLDRRPVRAAPVEISASERVSGTWLVDAAPRFAARTGRFDGYVGRLRRQLARPSERPTPRAADRLRQLLHELRTPVNAIQGFAEVIQQQVFGPAPHEYRALAASIAGDAARILAGFEELERLARLESDGVEPSGGSVDFAAIVRQQVDQLQGVLSTRVARFEVELSDVPLWAALSQEDAEMLAWRMLGTLASATGAGEAIAIELSKDTGGLTLNASLPASLAETKDIFSSQTHHAAGAAGIGLFGAGFAFRLARAEARAAGGSFARDGASLVLNLPLASTDGDKAGARNVPNGTFG
ncbi:MAG: histidine kinase dimerization/phospho-acceptor domain-containing protein [Sphingomonadaceae bacterium]